MNDKKVIIAHFGKQHSYRLAEAIKKKGSLQKYITTIYLKSCNWTALAKLILKGDNLNRVKSRNCSVLSNNEVKQFCEFGGLINLILLRMDKSQKIYIKWARFIARRFAKKVAKYAIKNNPDAIVMYDTNAAICFDILENKAPHIKRILDVSSATHAYMKMIYEEDMKRCPDFAGSLRKSADYFWDEETLKRYEKEIKLTHHFLVPSKFVQKSLEYHGISPEKIHLCPYGVDTSKFVGKQVEKTSSKLRCVYVGGLTQRKGIYYLLEAFTNYRKDDVSLTLVGNYDNSDGAFDNYLDKYDFTGFVTHEKVAEILSKSNLMVFPSLSEGLSLSVMEAMGSGIPVICSENAGYSGIIKDEYNGFLIPVGDIEKIREKVDWFLNHKDQLPRIRENARNTALQFTWERYNERVADIINNILKE
jgi:glycosyltransferase involved in cell wall biosynthesis